MSGQLCHLCQQRPACLHLTLAPSPGRGSELRCLSLCHSCAEEHQLDADSPLGELDQLFNPLAVVEKGPEQTPVCPHCGLNQSLMLAQQRFGCPACYQTFSERVVGLLEEMHGASHHLGRSASGNDTQAAQRIVSRARLSQELEQALSEEDFTRAAQLRDALRSLDQAP